MTNVISVRFRGGCKTYYFDPRELTVQDGDDVIVETNQGLEFVHCTQGNHPVADSMVVQPLRPVLRLATENDRRTAQLCRQKEKDAFRICQKKIAEHKLEMKLVRVECNFDSSKILFFFTADGRVDFRELVKDLASVFRARIELRQIGVRDEAKMLGGLGICGRPFCCSQFMEDFVPVSIKMAKTQSLSLNPTKISGTCGRLMCCLKYEQAAYEEALKHLPKNDSFVQTPDGPVSTRSRTAPSATTTARSACCATARAAATASRCPPSAPRATLMSRTRSSRRRRSCPTSRPPTSPRSRARPEAPQAPTSRSAAAAAADAGAAQSPRARPSPPRTPRSSPPSRAADLTRRSSRSPRAEAAAADAPDAAAAARARPDPPRSRSKSPRSPSSRGRRGPPRRPRPPVSRPRAKSRATAADAATRAAPTLPRRRNNRAWENLTAF